MSFKDLNRPAVALLATAVLAGGVAACGGDDDGGGEDSEEARTELGLALSEGLQGIESGTFDANFDVSAEGDQAGDAAITFSGAFDGQSADVDVNADIDGEGESVSFDGGLTATTDNLFVDIGPLGVYELGTERFQAFAEAGAAAQTTTPAELGNFTESCRTAAEQNGGDPAACDELDPDSWIEGASDEGTEEVDGVETEHYSADLDFAAAFNDFITVAPDLVPAEQRSAFDALNTDEAQQQIEDAFQGATIDVYRGVDDGITRKMELGFDVESEGDEAAIDFSLEFGAVNEPQTIAAPQGAQPIEELLSQVPPPFNAIAQCFLDARSAAEINQCSTGAGLTPSLTPPPSAG